MMVTIMMMMTMMMTMTTRLTASRETLARAKDGPGSGGGSGPRGGGGAGGTMLSSLSRKPHEMSRPWCARQQRRFRLWGDGLSGKLVSALTGGLGV
jgi:hypothetical protein